MGLSRYKLGELIEQCDVRNDKLKYTLKDVKGYQFKRYLLKPKLI